MSNASPVIGHCSSCVYRMVEDYKDVQRKTGKFQMVHLLFTTLLPDKQTDERNR